MASENDHEFSTAALRDPAAVADDAHARRTLEQLWDAALSGDVDVLDVQDYRQAAERFGGDES